MSCSINWDAIAGISSAVIALCALIFTIWQFRVQRDYNKLSVKPYLTSWTSISTEGYIVLKLMNNGLGPAHIKSFAIYVDGQRMAGVGLEPHQKCLHLLFPDYKYEWYGSYLGVDYMMASREERDLIAIKFTGESTPSRAEVDHRAKRARVVINIESIFGEKLPPYDSELEEKKQEYNYASHRNQPR